MTDVFSTQERSAIMAKVKSGNTRPELVIRSMIHRMGYRFRLHRRDLPGSPDIVLPKLRKVIFVHGCFWHGHEGCPRSARPVQNAVFWDKKLSRNIQRDNANLSKLEELGWTCLIIWTCEMKDRERVSRRLKEFLSSGLDSISAQGQAVRGMTAKGFKLP